MDRENNTLSTLMLDKKIIDKYRRVIDEVHDEKKVDKRIIEDAIYTLHSALGYNAFIKEVLMVIMDVRNRVTPQMIVNVLISGIKSIEHELINGASESGLDLKGILGNDEGD